MKNIIIISVNDFLNEADRNNIRNLDSPEIQDAARGLKIQNFKFWTGKDLLKLNVDFEGNRLKVCDEVIKNEALESIWRTWPNIEHQFSTLADEINKNNINKIKARDDSLSRIYQLRQQDVSKNSLEDYFFNGVNLDGHTEFGCLSSPSFYTNTP
ncbi:hypothetical protein RclHR1_04900003 [Rhizophagus clarus]|uniref:Uncharacterized protein n=1 Tax=Rhizophagus clarus TaxID=94130 RepID=A0A2Z6S1G0_9GLOM|nr:hypothetical protein RclHR1_04900003 [Rhizophagus clarus]GES79906.1 hypothetical protein GLOIN_2v1766554 [Rhizophagus clarus]